MSETIELMELTREGGRWVLTVTLPPWVYQDLVQEQATPRMMFPVILACENCYESTQSVGGTSRGAVRMELSKPLILEGRLSVYDPETYWKDREQREQGEQIELPPDFRPPQEWMR